MLNKPRGVVTTASDEKGRQTIYGLLPKEGWLAAAGRLDMASEGLLLVSNDPEWNARITAPETHLDKTYHVQVGIVATDALVEALERGVPGEGGALLRAKCARVLRSGEKNSWLEIVLDEGKNRQIRRMLDALAIEVLQLVRVAIGPLMLGKLAKGSYRKLTKAEMEAMGQATSGARREDLI